MASVDIKERLSELAELGHAASAGFIRQVAEEAIAILSTSEAQTVFDLKAFGVENRTRCEAVKGFDHPLGLRTLSDWMVALSGEVGEAANVVKKLNRVRDGITGNDRSEADLRQDLADELADAFIYLDLLAQSEGIDLPKAIRSKFDRTSAKIGYGASAP